MSVVYGSTSLALAAIETFVNLEPKFLPKDLVSIEGLIPDELEIALEDTGLRIINESGVIYNLFADRWQLSTDMDVNYMVVAEKAAA